MRKYALLEHAWVLTNSTYSYTTRDASFPKLFVHCKSKGKTSNLRLSATLEMCLITRDERRSHWEVMALVTQRQRVSIRNAKLLCNSRCMLNAYFWMKTSKDWSGCMQGKQWEKWCVRMDKNSKGECAIRWWAFEICFWFASLISRSSLAIRTSR